MQAADTCQYVNAACADYVGGKFSHMVGLRPLHWYSYEEYIRAWGIQSMAVVVQLDTLGRVSIIRHDFPPAYRPEPDRKGMFLLLPHPESGAKHSEGRKRWSAPVWTADEAHAKRCAQWGYLVVSATVEPSLGGYVYEYTPTWVKARLWAIMLF
jgi:hypothetical protein